VKWHLPAEYEPQVLVSRVHKSLETSWGMNTELAELAVKRSKSVHVPICLLVFEWAGCWKQSWNVHVVSVVPRLQDLLADAHLQQTVASKMEEAKRPFTVGGGTFKTYTCKKPPTTFDAEQGQLEGKLVEGKLMAQDNIPFASVDPHLVSSKFEIPHAPRASSPPRPTKIDGRSRAGSSSMPPYRRPASLSSTLKRARVTDEVKLAEFIWTLAAVFPAECRNPAYVEKLVTTVAHSKLCGTEVAYAIKPSHLHYEVGRLSVEWVEDSHCWDVIFLSLENQGCTEISGAEVTAHFSHRINSLRKTGVQKKLPAF